MSDATDNTPMPQRKAEIKYALGELSVDDIVAGLDDGSIVLDPPEPPVDENSPTWWNDVENRVNPLPPFDRVSMKEPERYGEVRAAVYAARGVEVTPLPESAGIDFEPGRQDPSASKEPEQPSKQPAPRSLDQLGRALGDEPLDGRMTVRLPLRGAIDVHSAYVDSAGGLVIRHVTRDGMSSYFEDEWTVASGDVPAVLARLIDDCFSDTFDPNVLPVSERTEFLLRLIRYRFSDSGSATEWLNAAGIPFNYGDAYNAGLAGLIQEVDSGEETGA